MAAEVARSPSQTSTGTGSAQVGGNGGGGSAVVAVHSSGPKSPFHFNSPSSSSVTRAPSQTSVSSPQQYQTQSQSQSQSHYRPASPSEEVSNSSSSFFSHHTQRLSPSGRNTRLPSSASERTVPRGLLPMSSPGGEGGGMGGLGPNDPRLPMSPGDGTLVLSGDNQDALTGDLTAPRKRSKVSRACDECRRKKIRCDASSESGIEQCSSCKRVGSKCSFSRVPMKRGPSKGYIKELADRLNTLENSISTGDLHPYGITGEGEHSPGPSDSTSPPPATGPQRQSRKRTLSSSSEFQQSGVHLQPLSQTSSTAGRQGERLPSIDSFHPTNQHQHQQRSRLLQHESQRQLPHPQSVSHGPPRPPQPPQGSPDMQQQFPSSISTDGTRQNYWKGFQDRRASVSFPYDMDSQRPSANNPILGDMKTFEWDEESIDQ
ncbi:hypothetical protein K440DRAFT_647608 [Wilcoxina mikolae CBS 423.85]|nr:hypothetical protein K440DRAFT_647608 [Wilcoxina mikolae CBS 423.85]